jgi:hypothetical protein
MGVHRNLCISQQLLMTREARLKLVEHCSHFDLKIEVDMIIKLLEVFDGDRLKYNLNWLYSVSLRFQRDTKLLMQIWIINM